jgi:hypothetical protein
LLELGGEAVEPERWAIQALPVGGGALAWQHAHRLLLALERERSDDLVMLLACHSDVSEAAVDALERSGTLFDADSHPRGQMPGEGAAVLLLARSQPSEPDAERDAIAWVHRPAYARRDKSIDAPGRTSAGTARQVAADALAFAGIEAAAIAAVCSDADRHSPRATELFGTTIELMPDLDPTEDLRLLGVVQGHAGETGALWAVAGAAMQARNAERPALALSLADPHWRMGLVVRCSPANSSAATDNA